MKSLLVKGGMTDFQVRQWGIRRTWKSVVPLNQQARERWVAPSLAYRLVDLMKSLLGMGGTTDFQVRQWGIRRTWKSVVPAASGSVICLSF